MSSERGKSGSPPGGARCTLCPAACPMELVRTGPGGWRSEPLPADGPGLCPRGSALGELLTHRRRILAPARRTDGRLRQMESASVCRAILDAVGGQGVVFCLDGNVPCEEIARSAAWCRAWPAATLCVVLEPADRQVLLGLEAAGGEYLDAADLSECDGFLIVGDAFAANPTSARGVFDRRQAAPKTPIVAIDPAAGTAWKFATHRVQTAAGMELEALSAVASEAGVSGPAVVLGEDNPSASAAGAALAACRKLAILIAPEYGRTAAWRQIGYLAGLLASVRGGGVAPQTDGANTLGALRLAERVGAIPPAEAISREGMALVAVGCDLAGMTGAAKLDVLAAAAGLPNRTTDAAEFVLPVAMPGELSGTYLPPGRSVVKVSALLPAPAGVSSPSEVIGAMAVAAGVARPDALPDADPAKPLKAEPPSPAARANPPRAAVLVLARSAAHANCGTLTGYGSWQAADALPELRVAPADAQVLNVRNFECVGVRVDGRACRARVRVASELDGGVMVLPASSADARTLIPCVLDSRTGDLASVPAAVEVSR